MGCSGTSGLHECCLRSVSCVWIKSSPASCCSCFDAEARSLKDFDKDCGFAWLLSTVLKFDYAKWDRGRGVVAARYAFEIFVDVVFVSGSRIHAGAITKKYVIPLSTASNTCQRRIYLLLIHKKAGITNKQSCNQ